MKKTLFAFLLAVSLHSSGQTVFGYWYGNASVKNKGSANNYLVELILQPEKGYVHGIMNYYFKNTFRSLKVKGNYDASTRQLNLYNIPLTYFGSSSNWEIDCNMNMRATLRVSQTESRLIGSFVSLPDYRYTCVDVNFNLVMNADISKKDSVLQALSEYKETYQVWRPSANDTMPSVNIVQRKVVNYFIENQFKERSSEVASEIEVNSDSLKIDFYDNGEVDGDSISVFFNSQLIAFHQKLGTRSIHFDITLNPSSELNELSMFADNLGSIPPNTALMIINDGIKKHEVRLSSSLEKTATIKIRRKKK